MYKNVIFSLLAVILFCTCQKVGSGYIRGTVVERTSGLPIEGATVTLIKNKYSSTKDIVVESSVTNAFGEYYIKYFKTIGSKYYLKTEANEYFPVLESVEQKTKKTAHNIELAPFGYIKIRLIKTSSSLNYVRGGGGYLQDLKNIYVNYPHPFDTILPVPFRVWGYSDNLLIWNVNYVPVTGQNDVFRENVYVNKNDTVLFTITFN